MITHLESLYLLQLNVFFIQIIRRPVDISKIQQRIDDDKYDDMDALEKVIDLEKHFELFLTLLS